VLVAVVTEEEIDVHDVVRPDDVRRHLHPRVVGGGTGGADNGEDGGEHASQDRPGGAG